MRLLSFRQGTGARVGLVRDGGVVDITRHAGVASMQDALTSIDRLRELDVAPDLRLDEIDFLPAVPDPQRILCVGLNFKTHVAETGRELPAFPVIFTRMPSSQVGHQQPMLKPRESEMLDFEGELAIVIGRHCRRVSRESALSVVAGYSIYNDGSVRDWQRHSGQFGPGKNFPATGGFGPWIVTPDEIDDVTRCTLVTRLNGIEVQRASIDDLIFDIPALVEYCSTFTPLAPGDVIVTGTPGGVGAARKPPLWMKPGDVAEVEVSGIGILRNIIEED